ncbi:hypothetical protein Ddc_01881 [Ditylenchus destructor]|nr:hypothetical protein Ddc_01881 [Ditylenchus destructor]
MSVGNAQGSNRIAFGKHKTMALWTQHFSVNGFAIPSTRGLFSSVLLLFLALQLLSTTQMTQVSAMPNNRIYYAVFREDDVQAFPYYRLFSQETMPKVAAGLEKRNPPLVIGKKYDRNCFFSPVACMLAKHGNHLDEAIWNGNGRK